MSAPTLPVVDQLEHLLQHHDHAGVPRPVVAGGALDALDGLVDHALVDRDLVPFDADRVEVSGIEEEFWFVVSGFHFFWGVDTMGSASFFVWKALRKTGILSCGGLCWLVVFVIGVDLVSLSIVFPGEE